MKTAFSKLSPLEPLVSDWTSRFALVVISLLLGLALVADILPVQPFSTIDLARAFARPSLEDPLGREALGRSILVGLIEGTRLVLLIVVVTVGLAALIGYTIGMVSGYLGGAVDQFLMRVTDVLLAFPSIFLALAIISVLGVGLQNAILAMVIAQVAPFARLMRGQVLAAKASLYVANARAVGVSTAGIMFSHILPNIAGPLVVQASFATGASILGVAALGFLGVGAQPPTPDWGTMLYENRLYLSTAPHTVIFPGLAIFLVVSAFNILGETLRDIFDPRSRSTFRIW